jgi:hypothetical protein
MAARSSRSDGAAEHAGLLVVSLKIQQIKPNVVAAAIGGDDIKAHGSRRCRSSSTRARRGSTISRTGRMSTAWGRAIFFGVFGTNWYYRLDLPGVKEFVAAYQTTYPGVQIRVPGNVLQRLHGNARAVARRERRHDEQHQGHQELEALKVSARDRMQDFDAYMNPVTHQLQQTIYMATYNDAPAEKDDIFKILSKCRRRRSRIPRPHDLQARILRSDTDVRDVGDRRNGRTARAGGRSDRAQRERGRAHGIPDQPAASHQRHPPGLLFAPIASASC